MKKYTLEERYWQKVSVGSPSECWPWTGACNPKGYGHIVHNRKHVYAHRLAYEFANGPLPKGFKACHSCDFPGCQNPAHIFAGTHQDNMDDMVRKGRRIPAPGGAPTVTEDQVREIRKLCSGGMSYTAVAKIYPISRSQVSNIANFRCWLEIV